MDFQDLSKRMLELVEEVVQHTSKRQRLVPVEEALRDAEHQTLEQFRKAMLQWIRFTVELPWTDVFNLLLAVGASKAYALVKSDAEYWRERLRREDAFVYASVYQESSLRQHFNWRLYNELIRTTDMGESKFATKRDFALTFLEQVSPWFLLYQKLRTCERMLRSNAQQEVEFLVSPANEFTLSNVCNTPQTTILHQFNRAKGILKLAVVPYETARVEFIATLWSTSNGLDFVAYTKTSRLVFSFQNADLNQKFLEMSDAEKANFVDAMITHKGLVLGDVVGDTFSDQPRLYTLEEFVKNAAGLIPKNPRSNDDTMPTKTGVYIAKEKLFRFVDGSSAMLDIPSVYPEGTGTLSNVLLPGEPFSPIALVLDEILNRFYDAGNVEFNFVSYNLFNGWLTYQKNKGSLFFAVNLWKYAQAKHQGNWRSHRPIPLSSVPRDASAVVFVPYEDRYGVVYQTASQIVGIEFAFKDLRLVACHVCTQPSEFKCPIRNLPVCSQKCLALI
jgi:hypothetical protein